MLKIAFLVVALAVAASATNFVYLSNSFSGATCASSNLISGSALPSLAGAVLDDTCTSAGGGTYWTQYGCNITTGVLTFYTFSNSSCTAQTSATAIAPNTCSNTTGASGAVTSTSASCAVASTSVPFPNGLVTVSLSGSNFAGASYAATYVCIKYGLVGYFNASKTTCSSGTAGATSYYADDACTTAYVAPPVTVNPTAPYALPPSGLTSTTTCTATVPFVAPTPPPTPVAPVPVGAPGAVSAPGAAKAPGSSASSVAASAAVVVLGLVAALF